MRVVERSAIVPYTAAQMFALVNDVARYPEFLPGARQPAYSKAAATSSSPA